MLSLNGHEIRSSKTADCLLFVMTSVFVSGASGFIAQHIVKALIAKGYDVVGSVRSEAKGETLKKCLNSEKFQYELVKDITADGAFDAAIKAHPEVTVLLHTASPFFYDTTDPEKDLVIPAINGTRNILAAVKKYGPQIERVVITSSDAALYSYEGEQDALNSFDESSWNGISYEDAIKDPISAYYGAKTIAEKLTWQFLEEEKPNFKLAAVNPVYVFGPQAFDSEVGEKLNTSNEMINTLLKVGPSGSFENDKGGYVDVRDVAKAHIFAFENDSAINQRLFMTNGNFSTQMMVDIINEKFPQLKGKVPKGTPGSGPADIKTLASKRNEKTRHLLGFEFTPLEKIVEDVVAQIRNRQ